MSTLSNDNRPIVCLQVNDTESLAVGTEGVEKIEAYEEPGGLGPVLAFAVYKAGAVWARYNWLTCKCCIYGIPNAPATAVPAS